MADDKRHLQPANRIALGAPWAMKVAAGEFTKTAADSLEYPQSEKQLPRVLDWQNGLGQADGYVNRDSPLRQPSQEFRGAYLKFPVFQPVGT